MILLLLGCADFLAIAEAFDDLTNPLVVQASYLGVEPLPEGLDLGENTWANGGAAHVLMADAGSVDDLENAPITDASVVLEGPGTTVPMRSDAAGSWVADGTDGLAWSPGDDASVTVTRDGEHSLTLTTPEAPDLDIPEQIASGDVLIIDLEGQEFDNVLVTVVRLADGVTVYDSTPTDITALYKLTHSAGELTTEVPGSVFSEPGAYAVGVAGLVNADPEEYEGVNLALSALTGGSLQFAGLAVGP
ncbi:hypothetical protein LBMAG42_50560 [Deltaproteobacteria bacterium]|nr:hypothetical protein LBMAG42_50560 [Deltaproteobacteria bacterium]